MAFSRKKKIAAAIVAVVALLLLTPWLLPARAYRGRVQASLSRALGREVTLDDVSIHLLPRPGLSLSNLVIGEDPAFGPEPMLYAPEVTADVRLASLLHGRLEFSSLSAKDASFNVVRRADGVWSIRSLMERAGGHASPSSPAATPVPISPPAPEFPYLEATNSRVNFKFAVEKKPFALVDADFALWVDGGRPDRWHARLRARPIRSDANLSDMGTLRAEATLVSQSGAPAGLNLEARWNEVQLGQGSALFFGHDRGWRGAVAAEVIAGGNLESLVFSATASVNDFHRYDIMGADPLRLGASCTGKFRPLEGALRDLKCNTAAGDGRIALSGNIANLWAKRSYDLQARLDAVPVERLVAFARNAKKDLPSDLTADGNFSGDLMYSNDDADLVTLTGNGTATDLTLRSAGSESPLRLGRISFEIRPMMARAKEEQGSGYVLVAAPFPVPLEGAAPAQANAIVDALGYRIELAGPARLARLQAVARLLGMRPPAYQLAGTADLQLDIAGRWAGFAPPLVTGEAQLSDVSTDALGTAAALRIASGRLVLQPDSARLESFSAALGATGPRFTGAVWLPRHCAHPEDCQVNFSLRTANLSLDDLQQALQPAPAHRAWYQFGNAAPAPSALARMRASGQLSCSRVVLRNLKASDLSASLTLDSGQARLANLQAKLLGGRYRGEWVADYAAAQPQYSGRGTLEGIAMAQVAELMNDKWAEGALGAEFHIRFQGKTREEMLVSAAGEATFTWRTGALKHIALPEALIPPGLRFSQFRGHLSLEKQRLTFTQSRITAAKGIYEISGNASLERSLELTLTRGHRRSYAVGGTLEAPKVSEAQVSLTAEHGEPANVAR
jgi:uncharacterized protein involved in outer membrane biogenesis